VVQQTAKEDVQDVLTVHVPGIGLNLYITMW
jgi:hypothetical protein